MLKTVAHLISYLVNFTQTKSAFKWSDSKPP